MGEKFNVAILGAGALGSVFGAHMARTGIDVRLLDVNQAHIDAINENGLRLDEPDGQSIWQIPASRPEDCPADIDLILLLTKIYHTEPALVSVAHVVANGAHVLSIQNGLGNAERVGAIVPKDRVLFGYTLVPGIFHGPGHVETQTDSGTKFKSLTSVGVEFARQVGAALAPVSFAYDDEADVGVWQKAAFNCAMNSILSLAGGPVRTISDFPAGENLAKQATDEVVDVAAATGVTLDPAAIHASIDLALAEHRDHKPSMLQDMQAGRPTEIDALCGEVARLAADLGVAAPINTTLATLIRAKERAADISKP